MVALVYTSSAGLAMLTRRAVAEQATGIHGITSVCGARSREREERSVRGMWGSEKKKSPGEGVTKRTKKKTTPIGGMIKKKRERKRDGFDSHFLFLDPGFPLDWLVRGVVPGESARIDPVTLEHSCPMVRFVCPFQHSTRHALAEVRQETKAHMPFSFLSFVISSNRIVKLS